MANFAIEVLDKLGNFIISVTIWFCFDIKLNIYCMN